jgi:SAM-dependent methyltransferase
MTREAKVARASKHREPGRFFTLDELGRAADAGALAHYEDARYYEKTYAKRTRDVEYYVRLALAAQTPVLEYGIGNGRVALPMARAGCRVVGIDLSKPMLADLKGKLALEEAGVRSRVTAVHGDMRRVKLRRRSGLVIAPFNVLLHLYDTSDVEEFLARVRGHLAPGGRLVFDVSMPRPGDLDRDPNRRYRVPRLRHPTTGELVRYSERFDYDSFRQILLVTMEFEPEGGGAAFSVPLTHRQFFPRELAALLHYNGFSDLIYTGDFTDGPPDEGTDSLVVTCRLKRTPARTRLAGGAKRV